MPNRYFAALLVLLVPALALAQPSAPVSQLEREAALPLAAVDSFALPDVDNDALLDRDEARANTLEPEALQFAEPFDLVITPSTHGTWEDLGGYSVWRLVVSSPGAFSLNAGFGNYQLPEGAALWLYPAGEAPVFRAFTARDNREHGELWTPIVPGDEVVIELNLPGTPPPHFSLAITRLNHAYRPFGIAGGDISVGRNANCHVDVICPAGDDHRDVIRSVATFSRGGSRVCSAVAVNNTAWDGTPYVLTADHCGISHANAPSVVMYWNYENSYCRTPNTPESGGPGDGSLAQFTTGSTLLGRGTASDWALIELHEELNPDFEIYLAGWDRRDQATSSGTGVHHPNVLEKRISFEYNPTTITNYASHTPNPNGTHIRVAAWDVGTVQHGSSGSPFFSPEKRVVGQLHGGYPGGCAFQPVFYGRIFTSMNIGLAEWLDPGNTGVEYIDGLESGVVYPELPEVSASTTRAMSFDGEAVLTAGPSPFFPRGDDVSVSLWARVDAPGVIAELVDGEDVVFRVEAVEHDGEHVLRYMHRSEGGVEVSRLFEQRPLGDGLRHIAVTRGEEPAAVRVFLDGQRVGQPFFYSESPVSSSQRVLFVGNDASGEAGFAGLIDEFRLFRERVPLDALQQSTHSTFSPDDAPESLVAYYRFEADTTGFAYDFSDSGSSGEVTGDLRVASPFPIGEDGLLIHSPGTSAGAVGPAGMRLSAQPTTPIGGPNRLGLFAKHVSDATIEGEDLPDGVLWRSETVWGAYAYGEVAANLTIEFSELARERQGLILLHRDHPGAQWTEAPGEWVAGDMSFHLPDASSFGEWSIGYGFVVGSEGGGEGMFDAFRLDAPFPNPATDSATLDLSVRDAQDVRIELFDALGRRVTVLLDERMAAGARRTIAIDAAGLPGGMYVVRAIGEHFTATQKVVVVR